MQKTQIFNNFQSLSGYFTFYSIGYTAIKVVNLLIGFFLSTVLTTIVGQTGDWAIIAGAIVVTYIELFSKWIYTSNLLSNQIVILNIFFSNVNSLRIGILYGMFVDAFKLGS